MNFFLDKYSDFCDDLKSQNKYRELKINDAKARLDFSSNDYLCLSKNFYINDIINYKYSAFGSTGSRLISGNSEIFKILEKQIANDKNVERALILNSGFQANFSCLGALLDERVLKNQAIVFFDKANHSSLYQGVFLSKANLQRYNHSDLNHLEILLKKYEDDQSPKFIITESVFGMDGDISDMDRLVELASKYNCFLYIDEAHGTGVFGKNGYGLTSDIGKICVKYNFDKNNLLAMGTFSKGVGTTGAYVAGSEIIINYLINKASGFIYSTALPPIVIEATLGNWKKIVRMVPERKELIEKANFLRNILKNHDFDTGISNSHIIPIFINNEERVMELKGYFASNGIVISAVRPPTVQRSCIRVCLNIEHSYEDLKDFVDLLLESRGV